MTATEPSAPRRAGSLQPVELAQASVMAALCAATAIIAVVVPFAAGLSLLGTVPMGLLAYRYRLRVLIAATVAGAVIAFLIAGMGGFMTVVNCAYIGGLTGIVKRRGRGIADGVRRRARRRGAVRRRHGGGAGDPGPAAPPDLRLDDRQHQRPRRGDRPHSRHGARRRAAQARLRHRAGLLAVPVLRIVGAVDRHGHPHRLVGAVAGDGAACSEFPMCTSWSRRPTPGRSRRYRPGCTTCDSATQRPTTTRSARCR